MTSEYQCLGKNMSAKCDYKSSCVNEPRANRKRCDSCSITDNERKRNAKAVKKAMGICTNCKLPAISNQTLCPHCCERKRVGEAKRVNINLILIFGFFCHSFAIYFCSRNEIGFASAIYIFFYFITIIIKYYI